MLAALAVISVLAAAYLVAAVGVAAWWLWLSLRAGLHRERGFWWTWLWRSLTWPWWGPR